MATLGRYRAPADLTMMQRMCGIRSEARACVIIGLWLVQGCMSGCDRPPPSSGPTGPATRPAPDVSALRSLPYAGFSENQDDAGDGVIFRDTSRVAPGYTLISLHWLARAELLAPDGKVVHHWQSPTKGRWDNVDLQENGDILVTGADTERSDLTDLRYYILRMNWDGTVVWKQPHNAHHDVEKTPSGKFLTLTFERRVVPEVHPSVELRDDNLTLLNDDGGIAETFSIYDVLRKRPEVFPIEPGKPNVYAGKSWVNLLHSNSVEWMRRESLASRDPIYAATNVLVCFRHQDRIAIFDWPKREVVWAWGEGELDGPHDAQVLDNGNILVFDNGLKRRWSRVIELDPLTRTIVWEYRAPEPKTFYTPTKGSSQRLPNGNTLIANADDGQAFEVTQDGAVVWDYRVPQRNEKSQRAALVRAYRYDAKLIEVLLGHQDGRAASNAVP